MRRPVPHGDSYRDVANYERYVTEVEARLGRAVEALRQLGPIAATARCYKRPDSKLDPDPGPCGTCAACRAVAGWELGRAVLAEQEKEQPK